MSNGGRPLTRLGLAALIVTMTMAVGVRAPFAAEPIHFILIQPGSPGTTEEAAPLMKRLADYLAAQLPDRPVVKGLYVNTLEAAQEAIARARPRVAIVTLPYYLERRAPYDLRPVLATRPGGRSEDRYRLLIASTNPITNWRQLRGTVAGTLCHTPQAVARMMFDTAQLPFRCQPTDRLLRAIRQVIKGELAGVLVTEEQQDSLTALPEGSQLRVLHETPAVPPPLVVSFGPPDGTVQMIAQALEKMKQDPAAAELLKELRTDGFDSINFRALDELQRPIGRPDKSPGTTPDTVPGTIPGRLPKTSP